MHRLHDIWADTIAAQPNAVALIEGATGRSWTRVQLDNLAQVFTHTLPSTIARQRVTFALPNGPDWFAVFLGLIRSGATPVPLDSSEPADNQRQLARAVGAAFAWIDASLESLAPPSLRRPPVPALFKLTSGSTGLPRALPFTHAQLLADGRHVCASMDIRPDDLNLAVIPFGHSYGLGNLVVPLLAQGTALACADIPLPHALAALAARHRPTVFPAVPALLRVLSEADLPSNTFASIRTVISAGAPLSPAIARAFHDKFGLKPHGFYGSSETGGISYDRTGDDTLTGAGVGTALDGVTISPLRGQRIRVRSAAVFRTGVHTPADRAQVGADGRIVLLGRTGRMVKVSGRRLDLAELEATLRQLPGITDAFVAAHPDNPEELAAVLATSLDTPAVRSLLRIHLAPWKIPRRIVPISAFPVTARGKTDTAALRALLIR
ncbi:MAG: class I adenylate-forming enzyme family protein [Rariglobus sp.]